jgi:hypothetical protein
MMLFSLLLLGCEGPTAPTEPAPPPSPSPTLADQVKGTFTGSLLRTPPDPTPSVNLSNYEIVVTKINDTRVRVAPASFSVSATWEADLEVAVNGSTTYINFKPLAGAPATGNYVVVSGVGRFAYAYSVGPDTTHMEIFSGTRQ